MRGFSLLECVVTLVIIALIAVLVVPAQHLFLQHTKERVLSEELVRAINLARQTALTEGIEVILCKSADQKICGGEWQEGFIVTAKQSVIVAFSHKVPGVLHWRGSLRRDELVFSSRGLPESYGTFWYCNKEGKARWAVSVNRFGRARFRDASLDLDACQVT